MIDIDCQCQSMNNDEEKSCELLITISTRQRLIRRLVLLSIVKGNYFCPSTSYTDKIIIMCLTKFVFNGFIDNH